MGVKGDFARLKLLRGGLARIEQGRTARKVTKAIGRAALSLTQESFASAQDPYGRAWTELAYRRGQPLRDTGRLYNSLTIRTSGGGFTLFSNVAYAGYHQTGTRSIPRRAYFPDGRGVPRFWRKEFAAVADEVLLSEVPR